MALLLPVETYGVLSRRRRAQSPANDQDGTCPAHRFCRRPELPSTSWSPVAVTATGLWMWGARPAVSGGAGCCGGCASDGRSVGQQRRAAASGAASDLTSVLASRGYHSLLLAAALVGLPVALVAFGFLPAVGTMGRCVWQTLPTDLGWDQPKARQGRPGARTGRCAGGPGGVQGPRARRPRDGRAPDPARRPDRGSSGSHPEPGGGRRRWPAGAAGRVGRRPGGTGRQPDPGLGNPLVAAVLMLQIVGPAGSQVLLVLLPALGVDRGPGPVPGGSWPAGRNGAVGGPVVGCPHRRPCRRRRSRVPAGGAPCRAGVRRPHARRYHGCRSARRRLRRGLHTDHGPLAA